MNFAEFDNIVSSMTGGTASASESHGHLIGLLCVEHNGVVDRWIESLRSLGDDENGFSEAASTSLKQAGEYMVSLVKDGNLEYRLMLPDDDTGLSDRVSALAHWCQGFLFGLAEAGLQRFDGLPGDCAEILADLNELTNAHTADEGESGERDFFELAEYVKVGTQLIFEELSHIVTTQNLRRH